MNTESSSSGHDSATPKPETKIETVARLLRTRGGYLLVAGELGDLGYRINNHPQIITWDLMQSETRYFQKDVPSNVRGILFNRHLGHQLVAKLRNAAEKLHIPMFPMLSTRELKDVLNALIQHMKLSEVKFKDAPDTTDYFDKVKYVEELNSRSKVPVTIIENSDPLNARLLMGAITEPKDSEAHLNTESSKDSNQMRSVKRGETAEIFSEFLGNDSPGDEAEKLAIVFKNRGIKITEGAIKQAIHKYRSSSPKPVAKVKSIIKSTKAIKTSTLEQRITDAEEMLSNALAAINLFQELLPEIKGELDKLRGKQAAFRALIED